jgi:hypothetical protein
MTTTTTTTPDERSGLPSASGIDRLAHCPGSRQAEAGLPELDTKDFTVDGSIIHFAMESGETEELTLTQADIAAKLKEIEVRETKNWAAFFNLETWDTFREDRLWIRNRVTLDPVASAKPDYWTIAGEFAICIDWKTGYKRTTPSERNWQIKTQVVALWHTYPQLKSIRGAIAASRLWTSFDSVDYTLEDLERAEREIRQVLWNAEQPGAARVPGDHCRYCRAQGTCRENAVYALVVSANVPALTGNRKTKGEESLAIVQAVQRMTPAEMGFVFKRKSTIEAIYEAVEGRLKALPEADLEQAGYKLVDGNKNYPIADELVPVMFKKLGDLLSPEERIQCIKLVRGRAEELLASKEGISKEAAKDKIINHLGLEMVQGNKKLKAL